MRLIEAWESRDEWNSDYLIPSYNRNAVKRNTAASPIWLHFGAGNIARSLIGAAMDKLLMLGVSDKGIIVAEAFDKEIITRAYEPYDCLSLLVTLKADGNIGKRVIGSITQAVTVTDQLEELFCKPSLQIVSFTITEKGYSGSLMRLIADLCLQRYRQGAAPLALLSLDNCAHNGELLSKAILVHAKDLVKEGRAGEDYLKYLQDETKVTFPWSMIDKITPRPDASVKDLLQEEGFEDTQLIVTINNTYTAPYVNAEEAEYLVIEDCFPNGRPKLEAAGILFTDRATVDNTEKMKVGTCLNPLHTALAIFGCLLGYETIHSEMKDPQLSKLVYNLGYQEGLPVAVDPGILNPEAFLRDVLTRRLVNVYLPDSPQRIATDTSQKLPIRFGQTLKEYQERSDLDITTLTVIPLVIAGWLRYLMGVKDNGDTFEISPDPRGKELSEYLKGIHLGSVPVDFTGVDRILQDRTIFVVDLFACGLAAKIEDMFRQMIAGPGAVRETLMKYCDFELTRGAVSDV